jgi:hypothetical protein
LVNFLKACLHNLTECVARQKQDWSYLWKLFRTKLSDVHMTQFYVISVGLCKYPIKWPIIHSPLRVHTRRYIG